MKAVVAFARRCVGNSRQRIGPLTLGRQWTVPFPQEQLLQPGDIIMHRYIKLITVTFMLATCLSSQAATFTVTSPADSGEGSLRWAIEQANASLGSDTIVFALPGAGPYVIQPTSPLPTVADPVVIDGTTQPGFAGTPIIRLDGQSAGESANGVVVTCGGNTVRGLAITRFHLSGIRLEGTTTDQVGNNRILGNYIGVEPDGVTAAGNGVNTLPSYPDPAGILVFHSDGNTIGSGTEANRNVISGNKWGINIQESSLNTVAGNYVGTDASGA
ncbi:MAG TPA: hypothetical protein VI136_21935, partial [Verrucomicrobiae bacterium]